jgi:hypothetical protein
LQKSDDAGVPVRRSSLEPKGSQSEDRYWTISGLLHYFPVACSVTDRSDGSVLLCGNSTSFKSSNRFEFCEGPLGLVHKGCRRPAANTATVVEKAARLSPAAPEQFHRLRGAICLSADTDIRTAPARSPR